MPVDLSIKHVPDDIARRLRKRAEEHHRSLQGELMAILHEAVARTPRAAVSVAREAPAAYASARVPRASESALIIRQAREGRTFTVGDLHEFARGLGLETPDEAARWIRQERASR